MRNQGLVLGAFGPGKSVVRLVPVYMHWEFHLKTGLLAALAVLVGFLVWFARRGWSGSGGGRLIATLVVFHVLIAVSVALIDGGPQRLVQSYEQLSATDYYGAVPRIESVPGFLADYPRLMPSLPLHCQTHPPGGVLFLWLVAQWFGPGATAAVLATIGTSGLVVPAVYLLARETLAEQSARLATAMFMLAPVDCIVLSGVPRRRVHGADRSGRCFPLEDAQRAARWPGAAGRRVAAAVASLLTFSASFLADLGPVRRRLDRPAVDRARLEKHPARDGDSGRDGRRMLYGGLWMAVGYDPWTTFTTALEGHARIMAGGNHATLRANTFTWQSPTSRPSCFAQAFRWWCSGAGDYRPSRGFQPNLIAAGFSTSASSRR